MRKALALFTAALLALAAVPAPASAGALASSTGAEVCTWSDAVERNRHSPTVQWALRFFGPRSDAQCEALQSGLAGRLDALLAAVRELGVPAEVFQGLGVHALPFYFLGSATGLSGAGKILLAGLSGNVEKSLLHELGHHVGQALLNAGLDYDWQHANEKGREYLELRGYPQRIRLDAASQQGLAWWDRASEWFAEDFAYWAASRLGRQEWLDLYYASCGPPDGRVLAWFDELFAGQEKRQPGAGRAAGLKAPDKPGRPPGLFFREVISPC